MKILFFAGSLRTGSYNKKYVKVAYNIVKAQSSIECEYIDLIDYPLPVYNNDIEVKGFPEACQQLCAKVAAQDAIIISSPENNGSIAALLKNTVDWISRNQNPWPKKHIFLMGASPGALGAIRGLWHTRIPFEALGCYVYPEMSGLPKANDAFAEDGSLKDKASHDRLAKSLTAFLDHIKKT